MQGIYNYIPETNHVSGVYNAPAVLYLQFVQHVTLFSVLNILCVRVCAYFHISTFRILCVVSNKAVFCSSLTSCSPGMLLKYCLSDFEIIPVAPLVTGITFTFTFHMC